VRRISIASPSTSDACVYSGLGAEKVAVHPGTDDVYFTDNAAHAVARLAYRPHNDTYAHQTVVQLDASQHAYGIDFSPSYRRVVWVSKMATGDNDGDLMSATLDGCDVRTLANGFDSPMPLHDIAVSKALPAAAALATAARGTLLSLNDTRTGTLTRTERSVGAGDDTVVTTAQLNTTRLQTEARVGGSCTSPDTYTATSEPDRGPAESDVCGAYLSSVGCAAGNGTALTTPGIGEFSCAGTGAVVDRCRTVANYEYCRPVALCLFNECCAGVNCASNSTLCNAGTVAVANAASVPCNNAVCTQQLCCADIVPPTPDISRPAPILGCFTCTRLSFELSTPLPASSSDRSLLNRQLRNEIALIIGNSVDFVNILGMWTGDKDPLGKTAVVINFKPVPPTSPIITSSGDAAKTFAQQAALGKFTDGVLRVQKSDTTGITVSANMSFPKLNMAALRVDTIVLIPCMSHAVATRGDGLCTGNDFVQATACPTLDPVVCAGDEIDASRHEGWWVKITIIAIGVLCGQAILFTVVGVAIGMHCKAPKDQYLKDKQVWERGHNHGGGGTAEAGRRNNRPTPGPGGRRDAARRGNFEPL
jgi:hypothetical protein